MVQITQTFGFSLAHCHLIRLRPTPASHSIPACATLMYSTVPLSHINRKPNAHQLKTVRCIGGDTLRNRDLRQCIFRAKQPRKFVGTFSGYFPKIYHVPTNIPTDDTGSNENRQETQGTIFQSNHCIACLFLTDPERLGTFRNVGKRYRTRAGMRIDAGFDGLKCDLYQQMYQQYITHLPPF